MANPHIAVSYLESIASGPFDAFQQELSAPDLTLRVESHEDPGPFMTLEWLIPTAVVVYIGKSYFDGFLKEAGKDHYNALKKALPRLARRFLGKDAKNGTVVFTDGKASSEHPKYSLVFSVLIEIGDGVRVKFLVEHASCEADEANIDRALHALLEFALSLHGPGNREAAMAKISHNSPIGGTLLMAYDAEADELFVLDPLPPDVRARLEGGKNGVREILVAQPESGSVSRGWK